MITNPKTESGVSLRRIPDYVSHLRQSYEDTSIDAQVLLFKGLDERFLDVSGLQLSCRISRDQMEILARFRRHDSQLDDETWKMMMSHPYGDYLRPLQNANRELGLALSNVSRAFSHISGAYHGELKVKSEDRLARLLAEFESLSDDFGDMQENLPMPRTPCHVRQQALSMLNRDFQIVIDQISDLRSCFTADEIGEDMHGKLLAQEEELRRVKAMVAKCRDNPSQKMTEKSKQIHQRVSAVFDALQSLRLECKEALKRRGFQFYNRCGHPVE